MSFIIRKATNADCEIIQQIVFAVLHEYKLSPDIEETDKDLFDIERYYFNDRGHFAIALKNKKIVASVGVLSIDHNTCELRKMFALPEVRGYGFGKSLLQYAIKEAKMLGYRQMILQTASPLKEAMHLYKKFGFTEYQAEHLASRCDKAFRMEL